MKPEYPKNRKVRKVSRDARLLNIHLWNLADDDGRLQELPQWIIGEVFPTDEDVTPAVLREWLEELHAAEIIVRYEVDGESYIACHDFRDHQRISHPTPSVFPAPEPIPNGSAETPRSLRTPSAETPQGKGTGNREGNREQGTGKGANAPVEQKLDAGSIRKEAKEDFKLWQEITGHGKAIFDESRFKCYRARRQEGHDREKCQMAIRGAGTPDATAKDGTLHDEWRTIFRNTPNLEMYVGFAEKHSTGSGDPDFIAKLNESRQGVAV